MRDPRTIRRAGMLAARAGLLAVIAATVTLGGCGVPGTPAGSTVRIVAGFYPLQFAAEQVGGDRVSVVNLAQPGVEPHDLELKPRQVAELAEADLIVYLRGFQPALDAAADQAGTPTLDVTTVVPLSTAATDSAQDAAKDAEDAAEDAARNAGTGAVGRGSQGVPSSTGDPHFWLDPTRLAAVSDALADRLAAIDPAGASAYHDHAIALRGRLEELDRAYAGGLRTCERREIVTSHEAFGYLAHRYRLVQIAITGLSPEVEPTPQRLAEVAAEARRLGATTIFFETLVSPRVAEAIANEVGADTAVLDPLEGQPADAEGDYFAVMRSNLTTLATALRCR